MLREWLYCYYWYSNNSTSVEVSQATPREQFCVTHFSSLLYFSNFENGDMLATSKAAIDRDLCPNLILDKQSSVIFTYNHCETRQFIFFWLQVLPTNLHFLFYPFTMWCTDIKHPYACSLLSFMFFLKRARNSDVLVNYLYKKKYKSLYL